MKLNLKQRRIIGLGLAAFLFFAIVQPHRARWGFEFALLPVDTDWAMVAMFMGLAAVATIVLVILTKD